MANTPHTHEEMVRSLFMMSVPEFTNWTLTRRGKLTIETN
jgi:hypothetical protein